jgi:phosphoglycerate dehydrogenase-like enzyme
MRVAILDDFQEIALTCADWTPVRQFADVQVLPRLETDDAVVAALQGVDVVVAMRERTGFPRGVLTGLPGLRLIVTTGRVNASIDLAACAELGIVVCGTDSVVGVTPEHAWALIMTAAKRLDLEIPATRAGGWQVARGVDLPVVLRGKILGIVGLGRIGADVARLGTAFGMRVLGYDPVVSPDQAAALGVELVGLEPLLRQSDFVSIHVPLVPATQGMLGATELGWMKCTAWLVNTSRGPVCDEQALLAACQRGNIAGAALDVYEQEPLPADHPFRSTPNIIVSPHLGYVAQEQFRLWFGHAVEDIVAFHQGSPIRLLSH